MIHSSIDPQTQADNCVLGKIDDFFNQFKITTTLHRCGIRKRRGHSVRSLIMAIFTLPFVGKNFYRGIVINDKLEFGKDAAYEHPQRMYIQLASPPTGIGCPALWVFQSADRRDTRFGADCR